MVKTFQDQKDLNYSQLYNEHKRMVFFFAQSKTKNSFDADDLTSKTFIKGYQNFEKYNPQQSFKNWIITICNNTFLDDIRRGRISDDQFDKFLETSKNIAELPLYIDETPAISIAALSNRARRIKRLFGLDMIVVDYIQLMRGTTYNKDGRVQEISQITQGLKAIAKELAVPVVALTQLSRQVEQRDDHKPKLADLRESCSIEQDADVVMFVYREGYYLSRKEPREATVEHAEWQAKMNEVSNLAEIIVGKQRHGPTGNIMLEFEAMYTKFKDTQTN